jgi:hypothetical protein
MNASDGLIASVIAKPPFRMRQLPAMQEPNWVVEEIRKRVGQEAG